MKQRFWQHPGQLKARLPTPEVGDGLLSAIKRVIFRPVPNLGTAEECEGPVHQDMGSRVREDKSGEGLKRQVISYNTIKALLCIEMHLVGVNSELFILTDPPC